MSLKIKQIIYHIYFFFAKIFFNLYITKNVEIIINPDIIMENLVILKVKLIKPSDMTS